MGQVKVSYVWWAIGTFGVGGAILLVAILIVGWPVVLQFFIGTKIGRGLLFVGGLIATGFVIFAKGQAAGKAAEVAKLNVQTAKEVNVAAAESKRIDAQTDTQTDAELAKWSPKGPKT